MHLLMFDVDGTLIRSNDYDADCFVRAVTNTLHIKSIDRNWGQYEHVTDSGILHELVFREFDREPTEMEVRMVQDRFFSELDIILNDSRFSSAPIAGSIEFLASLDKMPIVAKSIATGGWETSCRKKLAKSGFSLDHIPLASANDAKPRSEIMKCSLLKALKEYGQQSFESITYVGDGSWDMKASSQLGWKFIGVGTPILSFVDTRPQHWINDFMDKQNLDHILDIIGITTACSGRG